MGASAIFLSVRRCGLWLAVLVGLVVSAMPRDLAAQGMALEQAVAMALAYHPEIRAAQAGATAAREGVREARSGLFPVLSLEGATGGVYREDSTTRTIALREGRDAFDADSYTVNGRVSLTQPLYDGGSTIDRIRGARSIHSARRFETEQAGHSVALDAIRAFLDLHRARALLRLADANLTLHEETLADAERLVERGAGDSVAVSQVEALLSFASANRIEFEIEAQIAEANWRESVGDVPPAEMAQPTAVGYPPADIDEALMMALDNNPLLNASRAEAAGRRHEADSFRGQLLPRLEAELNYFREDENEAVGGETESAEALVRFSWGFATGGGDFARLRRARADSSEAMLVQRRVEGEVQEQVRIDFAELQLARQQLDHLRERLAANRRVRDLYERQFEGGRRSVVELLDVENEVLQSRIGVIDGERRLLWAHYRLLASVGLLERQFTAMGAQPAASE